MLLRTMVVRNMYTGVPMLNCGDVSVMLVNSFSQFLLQFGYLGLLLLFGERFLFAYPDSEEAELDREIA